MWRPQRDSNPGALTQTRLGSRDHRCPGRTLAVYLLGDPALEPRGRDRVALRHVHSDAKYHIGLFHILQRVRHRPSTDGGCQTGNRGSVSSTATVIDLIRAESGANELLHQIVLFIRAA